MLNKTCDLCVANLTLWNHIVRHCDLRTCLGHQNIVVHCYGGLKGSQLVDAYVHCD